MGARKEQVTFKRLSPRTRARLQLYSRSTYSCPLALSQNVETDLGVTSFIMPSVGTVAGHCGAAAIFAVVGRAMLSTKGFEDELGKFTPPHFPGLLLY